MSEKIKRYGKILGSVVLCLAMVTLVGWSIAWGYHQTTVTPAVQEAIVSAALATSTDGDDLDDTWETGYADYGLSGSVDDTGHTWTYKTFNSTSGAVEKVQTFLVTDSTDSCLVDGQSVSGLKCVSEVRYQYDQAGRVWQTRQLASPGGSTDNTNDKITLTVYADDGSVFKTVVKGVGELDDDAIEDDDVVTTNYYDDLGRADYTVDAEGYTTAFTYTVLGQRKEVLREIEGTTAPSGYSGTVADNYDSTDTTNDMIVVSTTEYDDAGRLSNVIDAKGNHRTMDYNSGGQVIKAFAWNGDDDTGSKALQKRKEYDNLGRVVKDIVMASASSALDEDESTDKVTEYSYFAGGGHHPGKLYQVTTYNNNTSTTLVTTYDYDSVGRQLKTTFPDDTNPTQETHLVYNDAGRVARRWMKEENTTLSKIVYTVMDMDYYRTGQVAEQRQVPMNPSNPTTSGTDAYKLEHDDYPMIGDAGYPSESTNGSTGYFATSFVYNRLGQLEKMTDAEGTQTTYSYNWLGQKAESIEDTGGIARKTEFGFDRLGRQKSISGYADGSTEQETVYAYNYLGQVTSITYPDNKSMSYAYNPAGQVSERTDQRDIVTQYTYDAVGNLLRKEVDNVGGTILFSADIKEEFEYDVLGRMTEASKTDIANSQDISTTEMTNYTSLGTAETIVDKYFGDTTGKSSSYDHDQAGNLISTTYPDISTTVVERTIDSRGRIDTISIGTSSSQTDIVSYDYIGSRVGRRVYDDTDATYPVTYAISYDYYGRASQHDTYQNTTDIVDFGYSYDNNSNITDISFDHRPLDGNNDPVYNDYAYDDLNRLTGADYLVNDYSSTNDGTESFTMDDLGNRTSAALRGESTKSYAVNDLTNRYDESGGYDVTLDYDNAGNTTDDGTYDYYYDYENRLVKIEKIGVTVAEFEYDALGRRIKQYSMPDDTFITKHYYYNAAWQVIFEDDTTGSTDISFVFGNYIDEAVLMRNFNTVADYYYAHNHLFSPTALLNDTGGPVERYEYNAYGEVTIYTNMTNWSGSSPSTNAYSTKGNPHTFTGRRLDVMYGGSLRLMDYRRRTYNPQLGRFMQHDPLGFVDGMNLYEYVRSVPVRFVDPLGLMTSRESELVDILEDDLLWPDDAEDELIDEIEVSLLGCCGGKPFDPERQCCEKGKVVSKVNLYVINRSGGERTGWNEGHIDMILPGCGMVGFFGTDNWMFFMNHCGFMMDGILNNTPEEWIGGPALRPHYCSFEHPVYGQKEDGTIVEIPAALSTICEVSVCPSDAKRIRDEANRIDQLPGMFNLGGRNCSTMAARILGAGGILRRGIGGIDNPQNLIDQLVSNHGARCGIGYTGIHDDGTAGIRIIRRTPEIGIPEDGCTNCK